jgi:hypothetical protein
MLMFVDYVAQLQTRSSVEYVVDWSKEYIKEFKLSSWVDKICTLIAAIHTQISGSGLPVAPEVVENLVEWVRKDFASSKSSTNSAVPVNLYIDLIRCCLRRQNFHAYRVTDTRQCLLDNLRMHSTFLASTTSSGWLNTLLTDPAALRNCFLPAMMDDESVALMQFTDASGRVVDLGWYECPNGHRYAVGECTHPMEQSRCPECRSLIGGSNHNPVAGVKRIGKSSEAASTASKQGYLMSVTLGPKAYDIFRLGKLTTIVLRLLQHLIMLTSAKVYPEQTVDMRENKTGAKSAVGPLLYTESKQVPDINLISAALEERINHDWANLLETLQMNEEDVAMGLHMMLNRLYFSGESKYSADESSYGKALTGMCILLVSLPFVINSIIWILVGVGCGLRRASGSSTGPGAARHSAPEESIDSQVSAFEHDNCSQSQFRAELRERLCNGNICQTRSFASNSNGEAQV